MFTRKSRGFTLVELLVVIAIIGMLVGILLPAVNAARDAGRRTINTNNLKNIGLAVASYTEANSSLPPLRYIGDKDTKKAGHKYPLARQSVSWAFELLPFMEQGNIYESFDKNRPVHDQVNAVAMRSPISVYTNPRLRDTVANCPFPGHSRSDPAALRGTCVDYAANRGFYDPGNPAQQGRDQWTMNFDPKNVGPFVHNSAVTRAHVRDGMSSTIAIGDRWINLDDPNYPADEVGLAGAASSTIMRGPLGSNGNIEPPFPVGREDRSIDKFGGPSGSGNIAAFTFLDGHVQWLPYATDPVAFRALCTIDGGEVIPSDL